MKPGDALQIQGSPWKAGFTAIALGLVALAPLTLLSHFLPSERVESVSDHVALALVATVLLAFATFFARRALSLRGTIVTLSREGLSDARLASAIIPWPRILELSFEKQGRGRCIALLIDMDAQDTTKLNTASTHSKVRRTISARGLRISARALFDAAQSYWNTSIENLSIYDRNAFALARGENKPRAVVQDASHAPPYFTFGLLVILIAIFACELMFPAPEDLHFGPGHTLSAKSLMLDGGLARVFVDKGQWWRFFTAPLLHADPFHILMNGISLVFGGYLLERLIGWRWFGAVFVFSALTGALASFVFNPVNLVTVGASGGIVGLFSATIVLATRYPRGPLKNRLMVGALQILVPTLIPFLGMIHAGGVDVAAHFGGAFGGSLLAVILLAVWSKTEAMPKYRIIPTIMVLGFAGCAILSLAGIERYRRIITALDPYMPPSYTVLADQSAERLQSFPRDPRIRYARAIALYNNLRFGEAKTLLDDALLDRDTLDELPGMEGLVRALSKKIDGVKLKP